MLVRKKGGEKKFYTVATREPNFSVENQLQRDRSRGRNGRPEVEAAQHDGPGVDHPAEVAPAADWSHPPPPPTQVPAEPVRAKPPRLEATPVGRTGRSRLPAAAAPSAVVPV